MWLQSVLVWIRSKICTDQAPFTRQNSSKQICGWILMWETTGDGLFHWRKHYYGLCCFSFCLLQMLTDGLEWCGLLWCFYQLFGLSFWRHPFTAEHLLLSKWCNDTFLKMKKQTHQHIGNIHFWVNYFFNNTYLVWWMMDIFEIWY